MPDTLLAKALDALPNPVFLYDRELRVRHANAAALLLSEEQDLEGAVLTRGGEAMRCVNARLGPSGCGSSAACAGCDLRRGILESLTTQTPVRQHIRLEREAPWGTEIRHLRMLVSPFEHEGQRLALVELVDESELVELRGLLPVCGRCGNERADESYRAAVEDFLAAHPAGAREAVCERCLAAEAREAAGLDVR